MTIYQKSAITNKLNMISSRFIFLAIFSLQLSTFVSTNVTEDAQLALKFLSDQIEVSTKLASETIPDVWNSYISSINASINQGLSYDNGNFTEVFHNLTEFANILTDGDWAHCTNNSFEHLEVQNIDVNMVANKKIVYTNFLALASLEVENILDQFKKLELEFNESCVINGNNCNGTSKFVISEVQRLMLIARRIPYDFLSETHLLGYRLEANWAAIQASVNIEYHKVIQTITTCLALELENYRMESPKIHLRPQKNVESVFSEYVKLLLLVEDTFINSATKLLSYSSNVTKVGEEKYGSTVREIENAFFKINQTINSLTDIAQELNITIDCTKPDLDDVRNSSLKRSHSEYSYYIQTEAIRYNKGLQYLRATVDEIDNIVLQVNDCSSTVSCGSISEKLGEKMTDIPSLLQGRGNATAVLQLQIVTAIRASGYKIVSDVLDQLEAPIVLLKDCIQGFLYNED